MSVLPGGAAADLVTERARTASETDGVKNPFETCGRMVRGDGATLEEVITVLALDDHGVAFVRRLARLAKVALKFGETDLHGNQIV
jgi:hypothetical protein